MTKHKRPFLFWTPRILVIIFAIFISMFALDVFDEHQGFGEIAVALLMYLIPTAIIVATLWIAWKWELFGAIFYIALGIFYIIWAWGKFHISAYFSISGPLIIIGLLFFISWHYQRQDARENA